MQEKINKIIGFLKNIKMIDWVKIGVIAIVLISGIIYFSQKKDNTEKTNTTATTTVSTTNTTSNTTVKKATLPVVTNATAKNITSRCNLKITSPALNSYVTFPFTVKGILDKTDTTKGCDWNELASRAGDAELFYNRNGEGWKSAGTSVPIITSTTPGGATSTLAVSISFNLYTQALGLTSGTPLKIVFTELNIPEQPNPDKFEYQVYLR